MSVTGRRVPPFPLRCGELSPVQLVEGFQMSTILIVYGTAHGQTERVARRIGSALTESGHAVTILKGDRLAPNLTLGAYDGFVVAGSVRVGRYQPYLGAFVRDHVTRLNAAPSAFVSVCGAAGGGPDGLKVAGGYIEKFLQQTGWSPWLTRSFAGELAYTRYNPATRWIMKMISRRNGGPTDTSRDYDFTDWAAVDRFGHELASMFAASAPRATVVAGS
jgi:menaquinone-dependent protoporphyrinogen oxidase